jgi:DNA-3-methyladenine glycosylase II
MRRDPVLAGLIRALDPVRWTAPDSDLFAGLVVAIVSQQLSVKVADTIVSRLQTLMPDGDLTPASLVAAAPTALRAAGLSARKAEYIQDMARLVMEGRLSLDDLRGLSDDEVLRTLTAVRGIGRWTAEMILIFRLHRPDVLPLDDIALLRAVQRAYGMKRPPPPRRFMALAESWRPWRSVACRYLWASLE